MTLKSRLEKLTDKLKPEIVEVQYFGWANCTWSESEGLFRQVNLKRKSVTGSTKPLRNSFYSSINVRNTP
jgi:hypothetical protein